MTRLRLSLTAVLLLSPVAACSAQFLRLGAPFGDHMVLQHDVPITIWGTGCPPGDTVKIYLAGKTTSARSDWEGRWIMQLPPLKAGGPYQLLAQIGGAGPYVPSPAANDRGGAELNDVLVGDIVFGMLPTRPETTRPETSPAETSRAKTNDPMTSGPETSRAPPGAGKAESVSVASIHPYAMVRVFKAGTAPGTGQWTYVVQDTVPADSAALFDHGREVYEERHMPVGVIDVSNGPVCTQSERCKADTDRLPTAATAH